MKRLIIVVLCLCSSLAHAKPTRVVLTGAPAVGKSSIILRLDTLGWKISREAATDLIALRQAEGIPEPWLHPTFQTNIHLLQTHREEQTERETGVLFQDRSLIDTLGYLEHYKNQPSREIQQQLSRVNLKTRYFETVFFIKPLKEETNAQRFDLKESESIDQALRKVYTDLGYQIRDIEPGPLDERVKQLLGFLGISADAPPKAVPFVELELPRL